MAGIGLWGACKESRDIMEKTTDRSKKALERDAKSEYLFFKYEKRLPAIGRCSTSQLFMVQPQADHFVLQPTKIENINRHQVARDIRKDLNPGDFPFDINIGIEFNPEWESSWIRTFLTDFNVMCDAFRDIRAQLWVIDHNLKSKEPIPKGGSPDDCSFHVQDRKFFKVDYRWDPLREW
ncbi:hypothetical protein DER44DRAFT_874935 [Fusarium oxysporum]|nr:hypothetical protein DER44DRAFT_874935 [Fusarium oxysporum]